MTDYSELVKALRCDEKCWDNRCKYLESSSYNWCNTQRLRSDAAAAIEALQAELEKKRTADCFGCKCDKLEPSGRLQKRGKPVLLAASSMNGCEKLPKRGEWIETEEMEWGIYPFKKKTCSICDCKIDHTFMLACMDYFDDRDTVFHYCPNCGAKMEVQE